MCYFVPGKCIISRPTTINNKKDMIGCARAIKSITVLFIDYLYCVSHELS